MPDKIQRITPFLWFDNQAEAAVKLYTSVFENSRIVATTRYTKGGAKASGMPEGSVMTIAFQLDGQDFTALNGGPHFKLSEAISFVINCESQEEIDRYWKRLSEGGDPKAQLCGWLKDQYGLSWQVVPVELQKLLVDPDQEKGRKAMQAVLQMKKIDLEALRKAVS
ncbi:MAG TPA: VOC family protein [Kofleriaceae bacterium]|nr:VOC family protein [Kofleriaceae bacterium]